MLLLFLLWFIKTLFYQIKHQLNITWWERFQNILFIYLITITLLGYKKSNKRLTNTFFNLWDLPSFSRQLRECIFFNNKMTRQLLDPKHKGMRAWEYGLLLSNIKSRRGLKVLDLGSGNSALPFYLAKKGLRVTAFDLDDPLEKPNQKLLKLYPQVKYEFGSMVSLPYKNNQFDLVICITTIEHLDFDFTKMTPFSYNQFIKRTKKSLKEMVRVLKKEGRLFITTELYFPKLQQTDRYAQGFLYPKRIGAAFKIDDFQKVFLGTLIKLGCRLIGESDYNPALLKDVSRSNFRGRYFTTFALYAQKL